MSGDVIISITIRNLEIKNKKHVINSIKGVVKALAKKENFEFEFERKENRNGYIQR